MQRIKFGAVMGFMLATGLWGCGEDNGIVPKDAANDAGAKPEAGRSEAGAPSVEVGRDTTTIPDGSPDTRTTLDAGLDKPQDQTGPVDVPADAPSDGSTASLAFTEIAYPITDNDKRAVLASPKVTINGAEYPIGFNTILRSGATAGTGTFGQLFTSAGAPLQAADGSPRISDDNDHSTLIDLYGKLFMVSQFESRPGAFYLTELSQNATNGKLTAVATKPVDLSALGGGWVHCAGSRSPWKSHLGSEEYEPDARLVNPLTGIKVLNTDGVSADTYYSAMGDYFGGDMTKVNPYLYGYILEAKVTGPDMGTTPFASNITVAKHFAMGRLALELAYVMPDRKTAYLTDDGAMVGLYMFKASTVEDLSAGTLYAAKLTQTSATNGGSFNLSWINLGVATNAEIKAFIDLKVTFADLFDAVTPSKVWQNDNDAGTVDAGVSDGGVDAGPPSFVCPAGYLAVSHGHEATAGNSFNECLILRTTNTKGMSAADIEKAASRLETRRYAAMKGATLELNKEEGITFDPVHNKLYLAMSDVTNGMKDNTAGASSSIEAFSANDIRVSENRCGVVYELDVNVDYEATKMAPLVVGKKTTYPMDASFAGNTCDVNGIANPDNVTYLPKHGILIIGEDTGTGHQNDLIWSYDIANKSLTRILSTPYGSETTSPYFYPDINGWGYMMTVVQHPYGESDQNKAEAGSHERHAYTGYLGPFPKLD